MPGAPNSALVNKLVAAGYNLDVARACGELFQSFEEAKPYLGPPGHVPNPVKEFYSLRYHRYYYHEEDAANTTWEFPPQLQLSEWLLDASISGLDVATCRKLLSSLVFAVDHNAHKGEGMFAALGVLAKLTGNIVACGNSLEKYRTVRTSNPKVRQALDLLSPGCSESVLHAAGFVPRGDCLEFPANGDMRVLGLVNAKLQQLVTRKGFTGMARENDDTGATAASRHSALPGFRHQRVIFECSCCARPINDGSDRLVTRKHDAPRGEFRYSCETCAEYNLCEQCWDKFIAGQVPHPKEHPFQTHHPKAAAHNLVSASSDTNPWGVVLSGGSAVRARQRLAERTGL